MAESHLAVTSSEFLGSLDSIVDPDLGGLFVYPQKMSYDELTVSQHPDGVSVVRVVGSENGLITPDPFLEGRGLSLIVGVPLPKVLSGQNDRVSVRRVYREASGAFPLGGPPVELYLDIRPLFKHGGPGGSSSAKFLCERPFRHRGRVDQGLYHVIPLFLRGDLGHPRDTRYSNAGF